MNRFFVWLVMGLLVTGCVEIDVAEDNDTFACETTGEPCEVDLVAAPPVPRDKCDVVGTTNLLVGTCWWEQCRDSEKSLFPKIEGAPCVFVPKSGLSPWAEGTCSGDGICVGSTP